MHHISIGQQKVPVVSDQVSEETITQVMAFKPFQEWAQALDKEQGKEEMQINSILIQGVDLFGSNKIGFVKFKAQVKFAATGKNAPGIVFLVSSLREVGRNVEMADKRTTFYL
jgi:ADP-sugar diphosphatase